MAQKLNLGGSGSQIADEVDFQVVADELDFRLRGGGDGRVR